MNILNDDCQLLIIKQLCLKDQFALFEATKEEPTNRWNANLCYHWQHQLSFFLDAGIFSYFANRLEVVDGFLSSISPTVQKLDLQSIVFGNLICFKTYTFPKMRSLKYKFDNCNKWTFNEWEMHQVTKLLAELFPSLESLKLNGKFEGVNLKNWMHLRKLDLLECWNEFGTSDFEEISKLKMLEELKLPDQFYEIDHCKVIMRLSQLRSLTFANYIQGYFIKLLKTKIEEIVFCQRFHGSILDGLTNLRKVTILCEEQYEHLDEAFKTLTRLEHLDIFDSPIVASEIELWKIVEYCPSLKILNIASTDLGSGFFYINRSPMKKALDKRSTPLTLRCHGNPLCEEISLYFKHPNLNVSFEYIKEYYTDYWNFNDQYFCKINFSALDNRRKDSQANNK